MGPNDNPTQPADAPATPVVPSGDAGTQTPPPPTPMPEGGAEEPADSDEVPTGVPGTPPADNPVTPVEPAA